MLLVTEKLIFINDTTKSCYQQHRVTVGVRINVFFGL